MISVPIYNQAGQPVGTKEVDEKVFGLEEGQEPNAALLKQVIVAYQAARRQGTHRTKNRGEVAGSTRKLFKQKGTGRARMGTVRTPIRRGGGHAFQKLPRDFGRTVTRGTRQRAMDHAICTKLKSGRLFLVDDLKLTTPRTREVASLFKALKLKGGVTLATAGTDQMAYKSGRNIPRTAVLPAGQLSVLDVMERANLVMTVPAFDGLLAARAKRGEAKEV